MSSTYRIYKGISKSKDLITLVSSCKITKSAITGLSDEPIGQPKIYLNIFLLEEQQALLKMKSIAFKTEFLFNEMFNDETPLRQIKFL